MAQQGRVQGMTAGCIDPDEPDLRVGEPGGGASGAGYNNGMSAKWWAGELGRETLEQIVRAIRSVIYGHVVIMVQDGKVVQIGRTEKVRLR